MAKGIIRKLNLVQRNISYELRPQPEDTYITRGMRGEGYLGGYRDAIRHVTLALDGRHPLSKWDLWEDHGH